MAFKELTGDISLDSGEIIKGKFQEIAGDIELDQPGLTEEESMSIPTTQGYTQYDPITRKPILDPEGPSFTDRLQERADKTLDYMQRQFEQSSDEGSLFDKGPSVIDYLKEVPKDTAMSLAVGIGQVAGELEDISGEAIGIGYRKLVPEEAQAWVQDRLLDFSTTPAGKAGLKALGKGMSAWADFASKNPDAAMEIGSLLNLAGAGWGTQLLGKFGKRPLKDMMRGGSDLVHELGKLDPKTVRNRIQNATDKYFLKATGPAKGIGSTAHNIESFKESAGNAVHSIVSNKNDLKLTDFFGNATDDKLPTNLKQFNEAISQMKQKLFKQYDEIAQVAGDEGLKIDVTDLFMDKPDADGNIIQSPLNKILSNEGIRLMDKDTVDRAQELMDIFEGFPDGKMSVKDAQSAIEAANNLKSKVPGIDQQVADVLREKLNETMDSLADSRYSNLKKEYGHLKAIEETVSKAAFADMKKGPNFWDRASIFSVGEFIKGAVSGNKASMAKGLTEKAIQTTIKKLNEPNRQIRKMFEQADKAYKRTAVTRASDRVYPEAVNKNIDNQIKQLESQKMIEGPKALPGESQKTLSQGPEGIDNVYRMPDTGSGPTINLQEGPGQAIVAEAGIDITPKLEKKVSTPGFTKEDLRDLVATEIGNDLGIVEQGWWELMPGQGAYQFLDPQTGANFSARNIKEAREQLARVRSEQPALPKEKQQEIKGPKIREEFSSEAWDKTRKHIAKLRKKEEK